MKFKPRDLLDGQFWRRESTGLFRFMIYNWIWMLVFGSFAGLVYTLRQSLLRGVTLSVALPIWLVVLPWPILVVLAFVLARTKRKRSRAKTERWQQYKRDYFFGIEWCWEYVTDLEDTRFVRNLNSFCCKCQGRALIRAPESGGQLVARCNSCGHAVKLSAEFTRLSDVRRYLIREIARRVRKRRWGPDGFEVYDSHR